MSKCASCQKTVRKNQHAVSCDDCGAWTHRTCDTGISRRAYLAAVADGTSLDFHCGRCRSSDLDSTRIDNAVVEELPDLDVSVIAERDSLIEKGPCTTQVRTLVNASDNVAFNTLVDLPNAQSSPVTFAQIEESERVHWQRPSAPPLQTDDMLLDMGCSYVAAEEQQSTACTTTEVLSESFHWQEPAPPSRTDDDQDGIESPLDTDVALSDNVRESSDEETLTADEQQSPPANTTSQVQQNALDVTFDVPMDIEEPSLLEDRVDNEPEVDTTGTIRFVVIERATQRGQARLVDTNGYSYGVHRRTEDAVYWRCTKRSAKVKCQAMVKQQGTALTLGWQSHCHAGESGAVARASVVRDVKQQAAEQPFTSAYSIAETCVSQAPRVPGQRPVQLLGRIGNRHRQRCRPRHPADLEFDLDEDHVPSGFHVRDVTMTDKHRHLVMFTDRQLELLSRALCWYVDGTFHVVKQPFTQLWSVHAFVRADDCIKQLPMAFALMSARTADDYRAVLKVLVEETNKSGHQLSVQSVVGDFEAGMWAAVRSELPAVEMRGCAFHWGQAVWRRVQQLGLQSTYHSDAAFHSYCRQLMALPCLPWETIEPTLSELEAEATTDAQRQLCHYIADTWVQSTVWPPSTWSVFQRRIRSNNDVEGWHRRLNTKAVRGQLNLYLLIQLLAAESQLVAVQVQLVQESAVIRRQRKSSRSTTARLFTLWDRLVARERNVRQTLRAASHVVAQCK